MNVGVFSPQRANHFSSSSSIVSHYHHSGFLCVLKISAMNKVNLHSLRAARFPAQDVAIRSCFHLHHILPFLAPGQFA